MQGDAGEPVHQPVFRQGLAMRQMTVCGSEDAVLPSPSVLALRMTLGIASRGKPAYGSVAASGVDRAEGAVPDSMDATTMVAPSTSEISACSISAAEMSHIPRNTVPSFTVSVPPQAVRRLQDYGPRDHD